MITGLISGLMQQVMLGFQTRPRSILTLQHPQFISSISSHLWVPEVRGEELQGVSDVNSHPFSHQVGGLVKGMVGG